MTDEPQHPKLEAILLRIEHKLDMLIERESARLQFESLRAQLDRLEERQRQS